MSPPWRLISVLSLVSSYLLTPRSSSWFVTGFVGIFLTAWLFQLLVWAAWAVLLWPKLLSPLKGLPEPSDNHFFLGQFPRISREPSGAPMIDWTNTIPNDGIIRYLGFLNQERLLLTSPQALNEVLVNKNYEFPKPQQLIHLIGRMVGVGVLLAEGDEHKFQRKHLLPAFAFRHIKDLYPLFWGKAREGILAMTEQVSLDAARASYGQAVESGAGNEKLPEGTVFLEATGWASRITLDTIGVAGLGRDFGAIKDSENELAKSYSVCFQTSGQAQALSILGLFFPPRLVNMLPIKRNEEVGKARKVIRAACRNLIQEKKAKMANSKRTDVDILSVALESGVFSEENMVDQLMTFLAAGHETTASAVVWAIYMLCLHPEVQTRLRAEVHEHLASPDVDVCSADIDHMLYLNAVCNETLRYFTPVPSTFRQATCDTTILGHPVRAGTRIMISPWATNRSVELWGPDAGRFNPDRWLPYYDGDHGGPTGHASNRYAFLTFLHGPRSCMGAGFARAEMACLLAAWVGRFEFSLRYPEEMDEKKMEIKGGITARPTNGLHVKVKIVDSW